MYNNDYIVAIDENGQPYIAHAYATDSKGRNTSRGFKNAFSGFRVKWGSNTGNTPKYKEKIPLGNGKFRYVYEQAKKAAKKAWGSKVGRFIDEHDAGISERLMARRASRKAKQSAKNGDSNAAKYYARRSRELNQESARERQAAKDYIGIGAKERAEKASAATEAARSKKNRSYANQQRTKTQADNLREAARNASGENFNKANARYSSAEAKRRQAQSQYEADTKAYQDAVREGHRANQIYNDSVIGKIQRKVELGKTLTKKEAQQFTAYLAQLRGRKS